tara:strand:+ start:845 stop:1822 length:978 start_codon:yes stop_codon:yes gene_type:complete
MTKLEQNIDFIFKKTSELNNDEIDQLIKLHNETMNKERSEEEFKEKYLYNFLGFSFHGLMKSNDKIVGCYNVIPYEFVFFSEKVLFGQWCENLIDSNFRGNFYNFKKLANIVNEELKNYKIFFVYGWPNKPLYVVSKRLLGMKDIGKLKYYVYPNNLRKFIAKYYPINIFLEIFLKLLIKVKIKLNSQYKFSIYKIHNDSFHQGRYGKNKEYKFLSNSNYKLVYKIENSEKYNNAKIIWIIDVFPLTKANLEKSVNQLKHLFKDTDLIVYIGCLNKIPNNLFEIPEKFLKRQSIFSGKILDSTQIKDTVFDISNWNINLSNFDHK